MLLVIIFIKYLLSSSFLHNLLFHYISFILLYFIIIIFLFIFFTFQSQLCDNYVPQCNDELSLAMSLRWLFTKRFTGFYLICRKLTNSSQNFCYSHSLYFHLSGSILSVSKQPTQLIDQLNSSLRHILDH